MHRLCHPHSRPQTPPASRFSLSLLGRLRLFLRSFLIQLSFFSSLLSVPAKRLVSAPRPRPRPCLLPRSTLLSRPPLPHHFLVLDTPAVHHHRERTGRRSSLFCHFSLFLGLPRPCVCLSIGPTSQTNHLRDAFWKGKHRLEPFIYHALGSAFPQINPQ